MLSVSQDATALSYLSIQGDVVKSLIGALNSVDTFWFTTSMPTRLMPTQCYI